MSSLLYFGNVMHHRMMPMRYRFNYKVFGLLLDIDSIEKEAQAMTWFSYNHFNLLSVKTKDHGACDQSSWRSWVLNILADSGLNNIGRVQLLCFPRVLGYSFNPMSVWYCENTAGDTVAIISEVRNTFGGLYHYVLHDSGSALSWPVECIADKRFDVSPFIDMNQQYHFKFSKSQSALTILINEYQDDSLHLVASQTVATEAMNNSKLLRAFFMMPMMSFKIMLMIHWHALKIWLGGGKFHSYDKANQQEVKSEWLVKAPK
jgi:DUF1365 family protein